MQTLSCRIAVVLAALLSALPAGWCCMLPARDAAPATKPQAPKSCCCGGCPLSGQKGCTPQQGKDRRPAFPFVSCCYLSNGALPVRSLAHLAALAVLALAPDFDAAPAALPNWEFAEHRGHGPSLPLHVLHCVWLC
jgi:hypothetical protein